MSHVREWGRIEAEQRISEVLEDAKTGNIQMIRDVEGSFEIRFIVMSEKERAGKFLARGGPDDE